MPAVIVLPMQVAVVTRDDVVQKFWLPMVTMLHYK